MTLQSHIDASMYLVRRPLELGGSWVVISGVISPLIWVVCIVTPLVTLLITTHEPPSRGLGFRVI